MVRSSDPDELFTAASAGDRGALARLLSLIERGGAPGRRVGRLAYPRSGQAYTVGMTGAPGAGKGTYAKALAPMLGVRRRPFRASHLVKAGH